MSIHNPDRSECHQEAVVSPTIAIFNRRSDTGFMRRRQDPGRAKSPMEGW